MIQLNEKQELAKEKIIDFIYNSKETSIILTGGAGTGKTATINSVFEEFKKLEKMDMLIDPNMKQRDWVFTATTNKATQALSASLGRRKVSTIHSALGLGVYKNKMVKRRLSDIHPNSVLIIDECSYIDNKLLAYIEECDDTIKIIYIGDAEQLPPVMMTHSPVFTQGYEIIELTQPMRQVNSPNIAAYCNELKQYIKNNNPLATLPTIQLCNEIHHYSAQEFKDAIQKTFITQEQSTDDHRIISYSNKVVQKHNAALFELSKGRKQFAVGDTVLVNSFVRGLKTDEQVKITKVSRITGIPNCSGHMFSVEGDYISTEVFSPDNFKAADKQLTSVIDDENKATPRDYAYLYERLADLRPLFACTVHKSQGSTFNTVYIDLNSFNMVRDIMLLARLLYVAISRATTKVIITGDI